jgi:ATP-binding cassette subfamily B protein
VIHAADKNTVIRDTIGPILRPHRRLIVAAGAAMVGATAVTLSAPLLVKIAIDRGISHHDVHVIDVMALVYVALVLTRPVFERVIVLCSARAGERFLGDLRVAAYEKLQELSMPFFEETRAGVLVSRLTNDVQTLTTFTRLVLVEVVGSLLLFAVSIVILVTLSPLLSLVMLVSVPLLAWSSLRYGKRSRPAFLALRDRVADTMSSLQEGLTGVRVVQSFGQESDRYASYRLRSNAQVTAWRRISLVNMGFFPMIAFAQSLALAAVLVVGGYLERHGRVSVGTIVAFALYLISLFDPIARLGDWFSEFQSGRAALSKIATLLETPVTVVGGSTPLPAAGELRADDVTFAYGDSPPAVVGVTIAITAGEHLALVGATGAGKSTLAKLLVRAYDPIEGHVSYGGVDLRDAPLDDLRRRIVFVPQEGHLFSGTITDNVRLARPDATDDEVRAALRAIGTLDRFEALPAGLETDVRSRGVRLSSGERQLVSIARVALVDPAVIVLDEATSSLDPQTEAALELALSAISHGRTVITIAHRLSTAERADRVAVMEHGKLIEIASHDELVANGDRYARLWSSWQAGLAAGGAPATSHT